MPKPWPAKKIPADSTQVPDGFNIITGAVLYKFWREESLQKRMDGILEGLAAGSWFVSMECLFGGFDYALLDAQGSLKIVQRNAETSFLTKHLRSARGSGQYQGQRLGRVLRNLIFSGKGLVENPANPKSVVRAAVETVTTLPEIAISSGKINQISMSGYSTATNPSESTMTEQEIAALKAENERLATALREKESVRLTEAEAGLQQARTELAAEKSARAELEKALTAARDQVKTELETVVAKKTELEAVLASTQAELQSMKLAQTQAERVTKVVEILKWDREKAEKAVASLKVLDDAAFAAHLEVLATTIPVTNNPQSGNTNFPHPTVNKPQPQTGLPVAKPQTGLPTVASASTDTTVLDRVEPVTTPDLATDTVTGSEDVRMALAKMFGYKPDAEDDTAAQTPTPKTK